MPDLNLIVRPFVPTGIAPGYVVTGTQDSGKPPDNVKLTVGKGNAVSPKSANFSHSLSVSYYMIQRQREKKQPDPFSGAALDAALGAGAIDPGAGITDAIGGGITSSIGAGLNVGQGIDNALGAGINIGAGLPPPPGKD
jgi:hypothetical protein